MKVTVISIIRNSCRIFRRGPRNLRRLPVTQTSVEKHQFELVWKTRIIIIIIIVPTVINAFGTITKGLLKGTGGLGSWRTSGDHPNYYIIENGQNTEKSTWDLRRLAVTLTPVEDHQQTLMWKTLMTNNNNNNQQQQLQVVSQYVFFFNYSISFIFVDWERPTFFPPHFTVDCLLNRFYDLFSIVSVVRSFVGDISFFN